MSIQVGDQVRFSGPVIARTGHSARGIAMRGVVLEIVCAGRVAMVDCGTTFVSEEGLAVRGIPLANLVRIK